jgi:hypothetical protein
LLRHHPVARHRKFHGTGGGRSTDDTRHDIDNRRHPNRRTIRDRLPERAESFAIARTGGDLVAWGRDARGIVYALTELADRVRYDGVRALDLKGPVLEEPATRVRSTLRAFSCEAIDKSWFYDKSAWIEYLSMLAYNRFTRFSLALGMAYNYPYHRNMIRTSFLLPLPIPRCALRLRRQGGRPPDEEREKNSRCSSSSDGGSPPRMDFQLGLWTQRYDFGRCHSGHYQVTGATDENHAAYCRDALVEILNKCPEITGLTFRVHVEGGIEEGNYDFWKSLFQGIALAGRPHRKSTCIRRDWIMP